MSKMPTRDALMSHAEHLVRSQGYSAFSYADLSSAVGITKASIHHHFPKKEDLGIALIEEYIQRFASMLRTIEIDHESATARLRAYGEVYVDGVRTGHLCLCGMMASEVNALPASLRGPLQRFFRTQAKWVEQTIRHGLSEADFRLRFEPALFAEHYVSALQGASLVAWASSDVAPIEHAIDVSLGMLD